MHILSFKGLCFFFPSPGPLGIPTGTVQPRELGGHVAVVDFCGTMVGPWDIPMTKRFINMDTNGIIMVVYSG